MCILHFDQDEDADRKGRLVFLHIMLVLTPGLEYETSFTHRKRNLYGINFVAVCGPIDICSCLKHESKATRAELEFLLRTFASPSLLRPELGHFGNRFFRRRPKFRKHYFQCVGLV